MTVRAKFYVDRISDQADRFGLQMSVVTDGSPENESFFKGTPYGALEMAVVNPDIAKQFEVGKAYYIDFVPVETE